MQGVPGVKHIIAVASGKGGVGKSTTAVNLALGLQANGLKVGILDADIYGPSQPRLLGVKGRPQELEGRRLKPMEGHGIKVMSMGFLVDEDTPMIWRGPMVISALTQMLREVDWGTLDVLVVDMPPGTGDAQLTMAQQVPLHMEIRETSDSGNPVVVADPDGPYAAIFKEIAAKVWAGIEGAGGTASRAAPKIVMES